MIKQQASLTPPYPYTLALIAFAYFTINMLAQYLVSPTADLDQAEQLLVSQYFQWGYSEQPPLYTWLVASLFSITGPSLLTLLLFKACLLGSLVACLLGIGAHLRFNNSQLLIVLCSLVFIPQIIWESQRDLTHSVLVTLIAAASLLQVIRTQQHPSQLNHLLLGGLIGLGLISKYNFIIYLGGLLLTCLCIQEYRRVLFQPKGLFLSLLTATVIALPHALWAFNHIEIALGSVHKLAISNSGAWHSVAKAMIAALAYLSPLWILALLLLGKKATYDNQVSHTHRQLLLYLALGILAMVLLFTLLTETQKIKDRWYQPLLFFIPLLIAAFARPSLKRLKIYQGIAVFFALLVMLVLSLRTILVDEFGHSSRPNMPYTAAIQEISTQIPLPKLILADGKLLAGNARSIFQASHIDSPKYSIKSIIPTGTALVLCETKDCGKNNFKDWLFHRYHIKTDTLSLKALERPFYYSDSHTKTIYWATVNLKNIKQ